MGNFLRKAINPVGAIFGLPDPLLDAILPEKTDTNTAKAPRQKSSLANTFTGGGSLSTEVQAGKGSLSTARTQR